MKDQSLRALLDEYRGAVVRASGVLALADKIIIEFFESLPEPAWIKLFRGEHAYTIRVNRAYLANVGFDPEDLPDEEVIRAYGRSQLENFEHYDRVTLELNRLIRYSERVVNPSTGASELWHKAKWPVHVNGVPLVFASGSFVQQTGDETVALAGYVPLPVDQLSMADALERYRLAVERAPDVVLAEEATLLFFETYPKPAWIKLVTRAGFKMVRVNRAYVRDVGVTVDEYVAQLDTAIWDETTSDAFSDNDELAAATRRPIETSETGRDLNGREVGTWVGHKWPIIIDGDVVAVAGYAIRED